MTCQIARRGLAFAAGALLLLAGSAFAAQPNTVEISNFAFDPPMLTVPAGTKVTWTNKDEEPHTIVGTSKETPFKSEGLDTDDNFSVVFAKPGTYKYFCSIHPHMVGQIVVK